MRKKPERILLTLRTNKRLLATVELHKTARDVQPIKVQFGEDGVNYELSAKDGEIKISRVATINPKIYQRP